MKKSYNSLPCGVSKACHHACAALQSRNILRDQILHKINAVMTGNAQYGAVGQRAVKNAHAQDVRLNDKNFKPKARLAYRRHWPYNLVNGTAQQSYHSAARSA